MTRRTAFSEDVAALSEVVAAPSQNDAAEYSPDFGATAQPGVTTFVTAGGITITRTAVPFEPVLLAGLTRAVDDRRGGAFSSGMEYPGRYSRWHMGYVDPCAEFVARGRELTVTALNERGAVLLPSITAALAGAGGSGPSGVRGYSPASRVSPPASTASGGPDGQAPAMSQAAGSVTIVIPEPVGVVPEEQRTRRPSVFTALRRVIELFAGPDPHLGLFGAFGYDLAFQFEPIRLRSGRDDAGGHWRAGQRRRDLVLHLPDEIYVIDRKRETAVRYSYDFAVDGHSTAGLDRRTEDSRPALPSPALAQAGPPRLPLPADPEPGRYAKLVGQAKARFAAGDLFEVVPSHEFWARCDSPASCYERLRRRNPAPYEFFLNLGEGEYLVGASPEMYVRVTGDRVETCPIAGTAPRGATPLADAEHIKALLASAKDEAELTMCTDVDRNDKSRVCVPGSVKVIGRRQIELYSRVIHTVDHVEGRLRPEFDALDAFLSHMWAVTVTGAPKTWAMQFIEDHEASPRGWYGGAVGVLGFDGSANTGLTLRTAHIRDQVACVRTGATLLFDSDPDAEEQETRLKARALLEVLAEPAGADSPVGFDSEPDPRPSSPGTRHGLAHRGLAHHGPRVLLVDHQDSFVHTLAGYFAEHGAEVTTMRAGFDPGMLDEHAPDLVVLSPGPGRPADFQCARLLGELDARQIPAFGVCLGLQAMVEHSGGTLRLLRSPAHGKPGTVQVTGGELLAGLPERFTAGRYHSLHARPGEVGGAFAVTAVLGDAEVLADGEPAEIVMAIEDPQARRWAVQFHPESIMTGSCDAGRLIIANVLKLCRAPR